MKKLTLLAVVASLAVLPGCKNAASADALVIDLTNAICAPLEAQPAGQPWVDFACQIAQGVENVLASTTSSDAGAAAATPMVGVHTVTIRVPAAEAATFMAAHRGSVKTAPVPSVAPSSSAK